MHEPPTDKPLDEGQPPHAVAAVVAGEHACTTCGYSLQGLPVRGACPECGTTVAQSIRGELLYDDSGLVDSDHGCISCEYPLRDLRHSDLCPECGTPVADSLRGDLLFYRNVKYANRLLRGVSFVLNGILLLIVLMVVTPIGMGVLLFSAGGGSSALLLFVLPLAIAVVTGLIMVGWWFLTIKDPGAASYSDPVTRRWVRGTVIAFLLLAAAAIALAVYGTATITFGLVDMIGIALSMSFPVLVIVHCVVSMRYVSVLAVRLPNLKIRNRARSRAIACPLLFASSFVAGFVPVPFASWLGVLVFLAALILYWNLLNMVRKALKTITKAQQAGAVQTPVIHIK